MTTWRGRRCRAAGVRLRAAGIVLAALVVVPGVPGTATAGEGNISDTRDVGIRLDLKALTHAEDGPLIVYTAETYAPFTDESAVFKWGIDRDHDEAFDLIVSTEWRGGKLVGDVKDTAGKPLASATVSRRGPTVIGVSFPAQVLGDASVYRYAVSAEPGEGERDLAPNSGLVEHRLGGVVPAAADGARTASSAATASPAPTPASAKGPAPAPRSAASAPADSAAPAAPTTKLPRTGPVDRALLPWAGVALMAGGGLVALGARRNQIRRGVTTGGIR